RLFDAYGLKKILGYMTLTKMKAKTDTRLFDAYIIFHRKSKQDLKSLICSNCDYSFLRLIKPNVTTDKIVITAPLITANTLSDSPVCGRVCFEDTSFLFEVFLSLPCKPEVFLDGEIVEVNLTTIKSVPLITFLDPSP